MSHSSACVSQAWRVLARVVLCSAVMVSGSLASGQEFVRLDFGGRTPVTQGDTSGCGPTSLLNLLKLGPAAERSAFERLSRGEDGRSLARLLEKYTSAEGGDGKIRYTPDSGMDDPNLTRLCQQVARDGGLAPFDTLYAQRKADESNAAFAARIQSAATRSLSQGVGPIISIDSYRVRGKDWKKLTGHYLLLSAIQRTPQRVGFAIEYLDPVDGQVHPAYVYASDRRPSRALAHFPEGDQWLENNPYLYVTAPELDLAESRQAADARHEYFLTILFGRLKAAE